MSYNNTNTTSTSSAFASLLKRDLLLAFRRRRELVNPLVFFVVVVVLFPLGVGPYPEKLQGMAAGIIWVSALLSTLLTMDGLFRSDFDDGTLEQLLISGNPVFILIIAKVTAHWLISSLPLLLISPMLANWLYLPWDVVGILVLTLLIGTPILSFIGAVGVALTVGLQRSGVLLALLILPLYIPVLIFASSAIDSALGGLPYDAQLYILGAMLALAATLSPIVTAAALRISFS